MVKNLTVMQEIQVQSLGWEAPLEKGMATHSSVLAWGIPRTDELAGYSPWGRRVRHDWATNAQRSINSIFLAFEQPGGLCVAS